MYTTVYRMYIFYSVTLWVHFETCIMSCVGVLYNCMI